MIYIYVYICVCVYVCVCVCMCVCVEKKENEIIQKWLIYYESKLTFQRFSFSRPLSRFLDCETSFDRTDWLNVYDPSLYVYKYIFVFSLVIVFDQNINRYSINTFFTILKSWW